MRLQLESELEESLSNYMTFAVIIAAILTIPLTITYWMEVEHPLITVADWLIWAESRNRVCISWRWLAAGQVHWQRNAFCDINPVNRHF